MESTSDYRGAAVSIEGVSKRYGSVEALHNVSLDVKPGEFVSLLGPSGSGKTTLLMSVAGFEAPSQGSIKIAGQDVTRIPPHKRDLGMVFQRYALFPHMTVEKNVAYPLKLRGITGQARTTAVNEALDMVDLGSFRHRRIDQLSGGQQQRVALARALSFRPPVLLMDEPLGALDRKLRERVQLELRRLHAQLGTTVLYVTHDQEEALVMSDRIAVMDHANIQQVGTPKGLYSDPANKFVAGFLGDMNFLSITDLSTPDSAGFCDVNLAGHRGRARYPQGTANPLQSAVIAIRPENLIIAPAGDGTPATVTEIVYVGARTHVTVRLSDGRTADAEMRSDELPRDLRPGEPVGLGWKPGAALLYPAD